MSDFKSRYFTYFERMRCGLDTHRDDIGTLQERKNKILIRAGRRGGAEYSSKEYARTFLIKQEILMTLVEDGGITHTDFHSRFRALVEQHKLDDLQHLSRQFINNVHSATNPLRAKTKLIKRLNEIRIKRLEEKLENE